MVPRSRNKVFYKRKYILTHGCLQAKRRHGAMGGGTAGVRGRRGAILWWAKEGGGATGGGRKRRGGQRGEEAHWKNREAKD
jgi:hypothetical protein